MDRDKKQARFHYRLVDPKTRHFVVAGTPGAVRVRVQVSQKSHWNKRDSRGRFATAQKSARSAAAKKGVETRRLKREGIIRLKRWIGRGADGSYTGYEYERYSLPVLDVGIVRDIVESVIRANKDRRFLYNGAADFLDANENIFTNNTEFFLDRDKTGYRRLIDQLAKLLINPSVPANFNRSETVDVDGTFVVIRFERITRTLIRKGIKDRK